MRQIVITLTDDGQLKLQSPFDPATTVFLMEKVKFSLLQPPAKPPGIVPAQLVPVLGNGHAGK